MSKPVRKALKVRTPSLTSISLKRISKETSTKISLIGVVKKKTVHKSINLTNQNFILPKKLGYIHNFN